MFPICSENSEKGRSDFGWFRVLGFSVTLVVDIVAPAGLTEIPATAGEVSQTNDSRRCPGTPLSSC